MSLTSEKVVYCPMCNYVAIKLVPLYDHDNEHKLQQCCVKCKRKIKKGQSIEKFKRDKSDMDKFEKDLQAQERKRIPVRPKHGGKK